MDGIDWSEKLMRLGWWAQAEEAIRRYDVAAADATLQMALLETRKECVAWAAVHGLQMSTSELRLAMLMEFDRYTAGWYFNDYTGEGSLAWLKSVKASAQTD